MIDLTKLLTDVIKHLIDKIPLPGGGATTRSPREAPHWLARLNAAFTGAAVVHCVLRQEPRIVIEGPAELSPEERDLAERRRSEFPAQGIVNDPHAILTRTPVWSDNPVVFNVRTLDFAAVSAMRHFGKRPALLSGGALVFCEATQELLLHRRAENSATYPGSLHILGGGYMPPGVSGRNFDQHGLVDTARREVLEEARVSLALETLPPMLLATESTTGFVQFVLLGVNLTRFDMERASPNWEGSGLTRVAFGQLYESLVHADSHDATASHVGWVPSGKAHVLAWLALGAPGAKSPLRFGRYSATELFEAVMSSRA